MHILNANLSGNKAEYHDDTRRASWRASWCKFKFCHSSEISTELSRPHCAAKHQGKQWKIGYRGPGTATVPHFPMVDTSKNDKTTLQSRMPDEGCPSSMSWTQYLDVWDLRNTTGITQAIYLPTYLPTYLSIYLSIYIYPSVHPSICLSIYLDLYNLYTCMNVCIYIYICIYAYTYVYYILLYHVLWYAMKWNDMIWYQIILNHIQIKYIVSFIISYYIIS